MPGKRNPLSPFSFFPADPFSSAPRPLVGQATHLSRRSRTTRRCALNLLALLADLAREEEVEGRSDGGDGRELSDLVERRGYRRSQEIGTELKLEP